MKSVWRIELFGGLRAQREHLQDDSQCAPQVITRFSTQKIGARLAYLAYHPQQVHSREILIDSLWPESPPKAGRLSLRVALNTLGLLLEPDGLPPGSVILIENASRFWWASTSLLRCAR